MTFFCMTAEQLASSVQPVQPFPRLIHSGVKIGLAVEAR